MFEQIKGNAQAKEYLCRLIEHNTIANSLLFAGPDGIGKSLFAEDFARKLLNCENENQVKSHPDFHLYRPEGKIGMHSIDSMRQLCEEVYLPPYQGKWKIFIIHDADRMLTYSANALLKTFEEPASDSVIILLSNSPESLLPTVLSRCRVIRFLALSDEEIVQILQEKFTIEDELAKKMALLSHGSVGNALYLLENGGIQLRERVLSILSAGKISTYHEFIKFIKEIDEAVETAKSQEEEQERSTIKEKKEDLTAFQIAEVEKRIEGRMAMQGRQLGQAIFEWILGWHRDMHLLHLNGDRSFLIHKDYEQEVQQAFERGEMLHLDYVQKAVSETLIALDRSTPLQMCLERFFLQVNIL